MTYKKIGILLGISRQRVNQIETGYISPSSSKLINVGDLKIWNKRKRESLGLPTGKNAIKLGGRDKIRELVRMKDNHTCQICLKKWVEGKRRFDVHHTNEKAEGKSSNKGCIEADKENIKEMVTLCHKCHLSLDSVRAKMKR